MQLTPIPNEYIARSVSRKLLNIVGCDDDPRFHHSFFKRVAPSHWLTRRFRAPLRKNLPREEP